jgi:hypothetical protein
MQIQEIFSPLLPLPYQSCALNHLNPSFIPLISPSLAAIPKAVVALMHVAGDREGYEERMESLFVITANEIDRYPLHCSVCQSIVFRSYFVFVN